MNFNDFTATTGWSGNIQLSPASWAYSAGNGTGTDFMYRAMGSDTYFETRWYNDQVSTNWAMLKICAGTGNLYNTGAGDGVGWYSGATGPNMNVLAGGSWTWSLGMTDTTYPSFPNHTSAATALVIAINKISTTVFDFYINYTRVGRGTCNTAMTGINVVLGGFNGSASHFDYMLSDTAAVSPYYARSTSSPLVTG